MAEQKTAESRMQKAVDRLVTDYSEIRAGRANPNVLDKVMVDYYGTPTPINQVGSVSVAEARILVIQPWDKGLLNPIMKAIQSSDIGINPQNDGNVIRLTFPPSRSSPRSAERNWPRASPSAERKPRSPSATSAAMRWML